MTVEVRNSGARQGDETVQVYVRDVLASVTQPVKRLIGFRRITLAPGESRLVEIGIPASALALWNEDMEHVVEPGDFHIMTGASSVGLQSTTLTVVAQHSSPDKPGD